MFNLSDITFKDLLAASILQQGLLVVFVSSVFQVPSGSNLYVLLFWTFLVVFSLLNREKYQINRKTIIGIIIILSLYFISECIYNYKTYDIVLVLFFAIIPYFIASQNCNCERILRSTMYLSLLGLPCQDVLFEFQYEEFHQASMSNSYAVVSAIIPALVHFFYFRKNSSKHIYIFYFINLYYLFRVIPVVNRGALLSIVLAVVLLLLNRKRNRQIFEKKTANTKKAIYVAIIVFVIIFYYNFSSIILFISDHLSQYGIKIPSFIIKTVILLEDANISVDNGRNELYNTLWQGISDSPLWGHGMGAIPVLTEYPWGHNFIMQFWYEFGVLAAILSIYVLYVNIKELLSIKNTYVDINNYAFLLLLFCETIPRYLISNDPWRGISVWMLFSFTFVFCINKDRIYVKKNN